MRHLPHVGKLTDQILQKVAQEKEVTPVVSPTFTVPVAQEIYKLAQQLRGSDSDDVTCAEVQEFAQQLVGQTG